MIRKYEWNGRQFERLRDVKVAIKRHLERVAGVVENVEGDGTYTMYGVRVRAYLTTPTGKTLRGG